MIVFFSNVFYRVIPFKHSSNSMYNTNFYCSSLISTTTICAIDTPTDERRKECKASVQSTKIAPFLIPSARRELLLWLLDKVTTLKTKTTNESTISGQTCERLLSTPIYYEPTLPQLLSSIPIPNVDLQSTPGSRNTANTARRKRPFAHYLLHRLKTALASPNALDDLLLSFNELLGKFFTKLNMFAIL